MDKYYTYRVRSPFGKPTERLLEFQLNSSNPEFIQDLTNALKKINARIVSSENVLVNDEHLVTISSKHGSFQVSTDIWNNAFIFAEDNPACILTIDHELANDPYFKKIS